MAGPNQQAADLPWYPEKMVKYAYIEITYINRNLIGNIKSVKIIKTFRSKNEIICMMFTLLLGKTYFSDEVHK